MSTSAVLPGSFVAPSYPEPSDAFLLASTSSWDSTFLSPSWCLANLRGPSCHGTALSLISSWIQLTPSSPFPLQPPKLPLPENWILPLWLGRSEPALHSLNPSLVSLVISNRCLKELGTLPIPEGSWARAFTWVMSLVSKTQLVPGSGYSPEPSSFSLMTISNLSNNILFCQVEQMTGFTKHFIWLSCMWIN